MQGARSWTLLAGGGDEKMLGQGPGTEMKEAMAAEGFPACQQCVNLAKRMNQWGPDGCRTHMEEIIRDIMPRAKNWLKKELPYAQKFFGFVRLEDTLIRHEIVKRVNAAIEGYENKLKAQSNA
jgi:hypothetical protein